MKKAFTLLEVVISITIFLIVIVFMYKVLDDTKLHNKKFDEYLTREFKINGLNRLFIEDISEKIGEVEIIRDRNKNDILSFKTKNTFYNPFYNNILYILNEKNLLRVESLNKIDIKSFAYDSLDDSYIDVIATDINKLNVLNSKDKMILFLVRENNKKEVFTVFKMGE